MRSCKIIEAEKIYQKVLLQTDKENIMKIKADVSRRGDVRDMFDRVMNKFGRVDVLINNAGINIDRPFLEMTEDTEHYERAISTIPMGRLGSPEDIFKVIDFMINRSDYITGQNFFVNGGSFMH
jgi:NAD(P)-dependent dehydrogenase (short-subunit alcohol dehydrogenase family)